MSIRRKGRLAPREGSPSPQKAKLGLEAQESVLQGRRVFGEVIAQARAAVQVDMRQAEAIFLDASKTLDQEGAAVRQVLAAAPSGKSAAKTVLELLSRARHSAQPPGSPEGSSSSS